jgi:hypothetical protein
MAESPSPEPNDVKAAATTDAIVGIWAFVSFAGMLHLIEVFVRSARGDEDARVSRVGTAALSFSLAGLVLRLSTRMQREYALGQTVRRLQATIDELERVVRTGAEEAVDREARASAREERMASTAETTLKVAGWALVVAIVTLLATIGALFLAT